MGIFKEKTREFRETVYQLFGWRVDYTEQRCMTKPWHGNVFILTCVCLPVTGP